MPLSFTPLTLGETMLNENGFTIKDVQEQTGNALGATVEGAR